MYNEIKQCRICRSNDLTTVLDLGHQALTGLFPENKNDPITCGPLVLCFCGECNLVQLRHSYSLEELYGGHYGYRSGLNQSMVNHLRAKIASLEQFLRLAENDIVLDIGSNDGTTLGFYPENTRRVGFDPSAEKFKKHYKPGIQLVTDFFAQKSFSKIYGEEKARIVTSIAMFYDLEDPQDFVTQVASILAPDGIWHFEQSYMPAMLAATAYDTVCHEHLEYYALKQIKRMLDVAGLKIIDIQFNDINGGSFAVTAALQNAPQPEASALIQQVLTAEERLGLYTLEPYRAFEEAVHKHRIELIGELTRLKNEGLKVFGYGASTKGNVILQYCGLTEKEIPYIVEINESKFGCFTPGTWIPIISESEAASQKPDVFLVLPWHFKENLLTRERAFLEQGGKMFFPLPRIAFVG